MKGCSGLSMMISSRIVKKFIILLIASTLAYSMMRINSDKVKTEPDDYNYLIAVISGPNNFASREAIRKTWASDAMMGETNSKYLFFIGKDKETTNNHKILIEAEKYRDIIIKDFVEDYYNLTLKVETAFRWAVNEFKRFRYFIKVDDDVLLNMHQLDRELQKTMFNNSLAKNDSFIFCYPFYDRFPFRDPSIKWYISYEDFPDELYPTFCSGVVYLVSKMAIQKLLEVRSEKLFPFEDVYFTGICRSKAGIAIYPFLLYCNEVSSRLCELKDYICQTAHGSPQEILSLYDKFSKKCKFYPSMKIR